MQIRLINSKEVICDGNICDPLAMWDINAHCGNCPIIEFAERFWTSWVGDFDTPLFEGHGSEGKAL